MQCNRRAAAARGLAWLHYRWVPKPTAGPLRDVGARRGAIPAAAHSASGLFPTTGGWAPLPHAPGTDVNRDVMREARSLCCSAPQAGTGGRRRCARRPACSPSPSPPPPAAQGRLWVGDHGTGRRRAQHRIRSVQAARAFGGSGGGGGAAAGRRPAGAGWLICICCNRQRARSVQDCSERASGAKGDAAAVFIVQLGLDRGAAPHRPMHPAALCHRRLHCACPSACHGA